MQLAPLSAGEFDSLMAPLGPFGAAPRVAVAVSGGADSLALALLAAAWARGRGGAACAFVVDHRLRAESTEQARATVQTLARCEIPARILTLAGVGHGPALAERARAERYAALEAACAEAGIVDLLLGHHAADQAETMLIRALSASGAAGLAGMAALSESRSVRRLRPLLRAPHGRLRANLRVAGVGWIEDPSNRSRSALRARLRALRADPLGDAPATAALVGLASGLGRDRARREAAIAATLAARAEIRPEGFALLSPGPIAVAALAALLRAIAGAGFAAPSAQVAALAADPRPATLAGVRLAPAGRLGPGWLVLREAAAVAAPVAATPEAVWDGRFRLRGAPGAGLRPGLMIGALGADAAGLRDGSDLPAAVLRTLPALRCGEELAAVPLLRYAPDRTCRWVRTVFSPPVPVAGADFVPG
jgi:tRNA(Ile)-lysidine synthase